MKEFVVDVSGKNFNKSGEDICGDSFKVFYTPDSTVVVLSDGLGSGVKANVLSTLTVEIVGGLATGDLSNREIVETLISTLPVCNWRGIAYSTFSILRIYSSGQATLVEYDTPTSFRIKDGKIKTQNSTEIEVLEKKIRESHFRMKPGEIVFQMSDGIIHAGIGTSLRMGWREDGVQKFLSHIASETNGDIEKLTSAVVEQAMKLWEFTPGDDGTVVAAKYRKAINAAVITGPAADPKDTPRLLRDFLQFEGKKIVCGGTTSQLVADKLGKPLEIDFKYIDSGLPPTAEIDGIDLVTEGMLTLNKAVGYLRDGIPEDEANAATELVSALTSSDGIRFYVGTARNAAHQNANFPSEMLLRRSVVETLADLLRHRNKTVEVYYY
ncbi:MAG: SpoIIE family protein phosphatase [Armatimonadota bacterium]